MQTFTTSGTCAKEIQFKIEGDIIKEVNFINGCPGSLSGISQLVKGMHIDDVITKFENLPCGPRATSCPDQFSKALKQWKSNQ